MYPPVRNDAPAPSRPSSAPLRPRTGLRGRPTAERQIFTGLDLLRTLLRSQLAVSPQPALAGGSFVQPQAPGPALRTTAAGSAGTGSRGRTGT
uniref:hypothetical protein n=1 Tax=Streptomyces sp. LS1784 TaxID=2851533 RepID=UPI001CCCD9AA